MCVFKLYTLNLRRIMSVISNKAGEESEIPWSILGQGHILVKDSHWLPSCFMLTRPLLCSPGESKSSWISSSSSKGTNPILRASPAWLNLNLIISKGPPPNTVSLVVRASTYDFGGGGQNTNIQAIILLKGNFWMCVYGDTHSVCSTAGATKIDLVTYE